MQLLCKLNALSLSPERALIPYNLRKIQSGVKELTKWKLTQR